LEWSDLKVFLAMTDFGSVRNAAKKLGVSYSTVSRHIANLERDLGVRLFDRLPGGYSLTADGADILQEARQIEAQFHAVERRILGQDRKLSGTLKVTLPEILSSSFLMEEIVAFIKQYPDIELDVITSYETLSLNNREADVAIRVTNQPPQDLVGRKLSAYAKANYASRDYLDRVGVENLAENGFWLGWDNDETYPKWVTSSAFPTMPTRHRINDPLLQIGALRNGLGVGSVPCFLADPHPELIRVPDNRVQESHQVWLLTHQDLRQTSRVNVFVAAMKEAFQRHSPLLQGLNYQNA
jgi:molybdate transport repressor ModE-like protein